MSPEGVLAALTSRTAASCALEGPAEGTLTAGSCHAGGDAPSEGWLWAPHCLQQESHQLSEGGTLETCLERAGLEVP